MLSYESRIATCVVFGYLSELARAKWQMGPLSPQSSDAFLLKKNKIADLERKRRTGSHLECKQTFVDFSSFHASLSI